MRPNLFGSKSQHFVNIADNVPVVHGSIREHYFITFHGGFVGTITGAELSTRVLASITMGVLLAFELCQYQ